MTIRRALLSVSDKTGLIPFAAGLVEAGAELIASGGTARSLREAGLPVRTIEDLTGFPEILGGRVKTLHPAIHAGLLARETDADRRDLSEHGWAPIDLVAVNLYPFAATVARPDATLEDAVENIDIGGVALLRAAAKNCARVAVVCDPADYGRVLDAIRRDALSPDLRRDLAYKAFAHTAAYDAAIRDYLAPQATDVRAQFIAPVPAQLRLDLVRVQALRYGENPHQVAALYAADPATGPLGGRQLQGKDLSYNNLLDLDAAWRAVSSFAEPTVVIVKHLTPCGIASADTLADAWPAALASDPVSAFGGVIAANRPFDGPVAGALGSLFVEAIAAPAFTAEAREQLARRANCRLLEMDGPGSGLNTALGWELRSVRGGLLAQSLDMGDEAEWQVVSQRAPDARELEALRFAWRACQHVKSNAIVLAQGTATVGIGGGLSSRVDAVKLAVTKAGEHVRGAALASDAFFPFPDGVEEAARAGVTAVVQPGGSVRDAEVIAAADRLGVAMCFTGVRHFRH
jgi:phosphoribosylaminoimidazolecarboxamide formyltransferase/IMP cyclohydrolase